MLPLNLIQAKGVFTLVSSLSLGLTPLVDPLLVAPETPPLAPQIHLEVPFSSQAPEADWRQPWQDACEETGILMVDRFYKNQTHIGIEEARDALLNILRIKEAVFGPSYDEDAQKMVQMIELMNPPWKGIVQENPTLDQLLHELNEKRPVILPLYAPIIKNPYYTGEGPDDHVVVLIGFDAVRKVFILNDPGTRHGANMEFGFEVIMEAINDIGHRWAKRVVFTAPK